jgi:hypothetical protein
MRALRSAVIGMAVPACNSKASSSSVAEARGFGAIAPGDGVQQGQRLMNDLAFIRGPAGANLPLDDGFVVIGACVAHVVMVIYWQMLSTERAKM